MRYLTKSRFKLATECPTKLFYTGKPTVFEDVSSDDAFLSGLAQGGYQVGELAKIMFPDGIEVEAATHADQIAETAKLLSRENVTIFEGAVAHNTLFARVDIIHKHGNSIELIEVKSKSYDRTDANFFIGKRGNFIADKLPYLQDIAFQRYVFGLAYPTLAPSASSFLMMPDKSAKATVDRLNQRFPISRKGKRIKVSVEPGTSVQTIGMPLLAKVSVEEHVTTIIRGPVDVPGVCLPFAEAVALFSAAYEADEMVSPVIGTQCAKCQFRHSANGYSAGLRSGVHECWQKYGVQPADFDKGTVLDIWNFRKKSALIKSKRLHLGDVLESDIKPEPNKSGDGISTTERQWMQVSWKSRQDDKFYLDRQFIQSEMAKWKYPFHFIDFETTRVAIPFTQGSRPYGNVAFQYSHHVMNADGSVEHKSQFLNSTPGFNPNVAFVRQLWADLKNDDGTVFMWSKHENTVLNDILKEIREASHSNIDDIQEFILSLTKDKKTSHTGARAMYDLCKLAEQAFFHPKTNGSSSIKKVLPAVLQDSPWLAQRYGRPIYGKGLEIPSLNIAAEERMIWWSMTNGVVLSPYDKLPPVFPDLDTSNLEQFLAEQSIDIDMEITEGAGAMMAFGRLQFEDLEPSVRLHIESALLRYCELDTLAMVMVVEAWREWAH